MHKYNSHWSHVLKAIQSMMCTFQSVPCMPLGPRQSILFHVNNWRKTKSFHLRRYECIFSTFFPLKSLSDVDGDDDDETQSRVSRKAGYETNSCGIYTYRYVKDDFSAQRVITFFFFILRSIKDINFFVGVNSSFFLFS